MTLKVGLITIGQSPRDDMIPEIGRQSGEHVEILEKGALDGLRLEEVRRFQPNEIDEPVVTKMRDGTEVTIGKSYVFQRVQTTVTQLDNEDVSLIAVLCAGDFSGIKSQKSLLLVDRMLLGILSSMVLKGTLGIVVPLEEQLSHVIESYKRLGFTTVATVAHGDRVEVSQAAVKLKDKVDVVVMQCLGYDEDMKRAVQEITGKPVLLPRLVLGKVLALLAG